MLAIIGWLATIATSLYAIYSMLTPGGKSYVVNWVANLYTAAFENIAPLLKLLGVELQPVEKALVSAFQTYGPPIAADLNAPLTALAEATLKATTAAVSTLPLSTPDNAIAGAAEAFAGAFGNGLSSAGVAALFEAIFPEKLNTLNGLAPMIAKMAGFDEVAAAVLRPLYDAAFGRSLTYHYRSLFKPELPEESDAVEWHSRRLLTDAQLSTIFGFSGLKPEYETPFIASAYRGLNPRTFATMFVDEPVPTDAITAAAQFYGLRDDDITFLLAAINRNSTKTVRSQYLTAAVRSAELGTMTPADLDGVLTSLNFSDDAKSWVQLTVATRKLEQLAELYRKSISEAYRYGQITDDQYVPALEAIGIGAADAQAHYAIDSIALRGRTALAAAKAESRLEASRTRAATQAAVAAYRTGTFDEAALSAALIAAGVDPAIAAFIVTVQTERRAGPLTFIYGREIGRAGALVLKEKVAAVENQYKKQLIDDAAAAAALVTLEIPTANANALLADWAALKTKPTTTGELLSR